MSFRAEIYVSYAKGDDTFAGRFRQSVFMYLFRIFRKKGYKFIANSSLTYKESLKEFVTKMGNQKYIILIISDAYLKSKNCMLEILEILKYPDFRERVFPIVLQDAMIYHPENIVDYVNFWDEKILELEAKVKKLSSLSDIQSVIEDVNSFSHIRRIIVDFASSIGDMNTVKITEDKQKNLVQLFKNLEDKIAKDKISVKKSSKTGLLLFIPIILLSAVSLFLYFKYPAKINIDSDATCMVNINNNLKLIIEANKTQSIDLIRGKYYFNISVEGYNIKDTINVSINWFWESISVPILISELIDKEDYLKAQQTNTIDAYKEYLIKHPYGMFVEIAEMQIVVLEQNASQPVNKKEELEFEKTRKERNVQSYQQYLKKYPDGVYKDVAIKQIEIIEKVEKSNILSPEERAFNKAKNAGTQAALEDFLQKYNNGKFSVEAKQLIDGFNKKEQTNEEQVFQVADSENSIEKYFDYLTKFPNGKYKQNALDAIELLKEEKAYSLALKTYTIRALEFYLDQYPKGNYVEGAKNMIQGLMAIKKPYMNLIQGGMFQMNGKTVKIYSFYMDRYEVTVSQYRKFCEATGRNMPETPSWGWQNENPIVNVTWNDANAYAKWQNKRLPTEAEWEFAAQNMSKDLNSISWNSTNAKNRTQAVGLKNPNEFGIYDLIGNVAEWCSNWYSENFIETDHVSNPKGPESGTLKVIKGGAWNNTSTKLKTNYRFKEKPDVARPYYGFRCVSD